MTAPLDSFAASQDDPAAERSALLRRLTLAGLIAVVIAGGVRLSFIDGWVRRVAIEGASMATALQGEHWRVTCVDCGFPWSIAGDQLPGTNGYSCPNCCSLNEPTIKIACPADRVVIDRWPLLWRDPTRGEIIAARRGSEFVVKRVAALPGEKFELRDGDVHIQNAPTDRSPESRRALACVVHDDSHRPAAETLHSRRWKPEGDGSRWSETAGSYVYRPSSAAGTETAWLTYQHFRPAYRAGKSVEGSAVLDDDSYNAKDNRLLHEIRDLGFTGEMNLELSTDIEFRLHDGVDWCRAQWTAADRRWRLWQGEQLLADVLVERSSNPPRTWMLQRCDGRLYFSLDGRPVLEPRLQPKEEACHYLERPLQIGVTGGGATIAKLRVLRDVYYLAPDGRHGDWSPPRATAADEFVLLGDNSPISVDSRQWPEYGVRRDQFIGIVIPRSRSAVR